MHSKASNAHTKKLMLFVLLGMFLGLSTETCMGPPIFGCASVPQASEAIEGAAAVAPILFRSTEVHFTDQNPLPHNMPMQWVAQTQRFEWPMSIQATNIAAASAPATFDALVGTPESWGCLNAKARFIGDGGLEGFWSNEFQYGTCLVDPPPPVPIAVPEFTSDLWLLTGVLICLILLAYLETRRKG